MGIYAAVIKDSISPGGQRLTTMEIQCHRFVLAEFNTHRVFSRNSASSRAIPVGKQLDRVKADPALPVEWPSELPGMQGGPPLEGDSLKLAQQFYNFVHEKVWREVEAYIKMTEGDVRLHKSIINRVLEPFMWHKIIVSSTHWENFFTQRCSPLAQPEIRAVAEEMREALMLSQPKEIGYGEWHLPYDEDFGELSQKYTGEQLRWISVARCCRVSYLNHGTGVKDPEEDLRLYTQLISAKPMHASPLEHVATPISTSSSGNFEGWEQLRHFVQPMVFSRC